MPAHTRPISPPTTFPFFVRTMGHIRHDSYHSTLGTYHQDLMLTVILSGQGRYIRNGCSYAVSAGHIGLVLPAPDPGLLISDPHDPYDHYYCRFTGQHAAAIAAHILQTQYAAGLSPDFPFFKHSAISDIADIFSRTLLNIAHSPPRPDMTRMMPADARLAEILILLDTPPHSAAHSLSAASLQHYLHDHIADPVDLDVMAAHFSISKPHLCRVARKELGRTLQSLWEQIKMDRARILLAQSDLSIKQIARLVGYTDPFYFSNVFHRSAGASPSHFRKDHTSK